MKFKDFDIEMSDTGTSHVVPIFTEIHKIDSDGQDLQSGENMQVPILPLRNMVLFPGMATPVAIGREKSLKLVKEAMKQVDKKDVIFIFPEDSKKCTTVRVLKKPKTKSSIRKVFLPASVAEMLVMRKQEQDEIREMIGNERFLQENVAGILLVPQD